MEITIGGNRLGSGKKMKARLNNYYRSTHNLSKTFASSMGAGMLIPCYKRLCTRGDAFEIDINADMRTIPTFGPLFGSFKMQVDVFQCPIRLYQGILHNNPLAIGLKMSQVKFPTLKIQTVDFGEENDGKFADNCLLKYLGISGIGRHARAGEYKEDPYLQMINREFNAIPALAYYDIYKTYYANKQEEKGYIISSETIEASATIEDVIAWDAVSGERTSYGTGVAIDVGLTTGSNSFEIVGTDITNSNVLIQFTSIPTQLAPILTANVNYTLEELKTKQVIEISQENTNFISILFNAQMAALMQINGTQAKFYEGQGIKKQGLKIVGFDLANIDQMRYDLLCNNTLGSTFRIENNNNAYLPYSALVDEYEDVVNWEVISAPYRTFNKFALNGIALKTYQNDIFNNWLNTEWIEGENGINELSKVHVDANGDFSMDALLFAQKLFNMLNRIAVAGATYEDWQDTMYEEVKRKQIESPIYLGGLSKEIIFDEIVQTAPAEGQALGTLGGRGRAGNKQKGGKIHVKCDEACYIIAIVSLTPRIFYTQGNEYDMTDVLTMDDIHKPAMDGIGFQDLIGERLAWWDTIIHPATTHTPYGITRSKIGKLPAWIEYMTDVDTAYGDFAGEGGKGYMILNRNYEHDPQTKGIKDATTYIDPAKYNYVFANAELDAQNFWCEIHFDIKARRLMSARLIPHV